MVKPICFTIRAAASALGSIGSYRVYSCPVPRSARPAWGFDGRLFPDAPGPRVERTALEVHPHAGGKETRPGNQKKRAETAKRRSAGGDDGRTLPGRPCRELPAATRVAGGAPGKRSEPALHARPRA